MILIDQEDSSDETALAKATREYYQQQSPEEKAEDQEWGEDIARDSHRAWD